jgi:biotin operon repressor
VDDRIKQLLQDLGAAINESISGSEDVNQHIQRIRDEGYDLYVVLDATIGLNKQSDAADEDAAEVAEPPKEVQFRINVNDLAMLRSIGIDPTRKVRGARRAQPLIQSSDD